MIRCMRGAAALALLAIIGSATLRADDADKTKPGPQHKLLAALVGTYEAKVKFYLDPTKPAQESTGTMKRKMIMDGRYLQETYDGKAFGVSFHGMGIMGYDNFKKKYTSIWIDNMATGIQAMTGTYDAATKTLTAVGEDIDPTSGKVMKARDILKIEGDGEQLMEMYRQPEGGKEFKMLEIRYTKKK